MKGFLAGVVVTTLVGFLIIPRHQTPNSVQSYLALPEEELLQRKEEIEKLGDPSGQALLALLACIEARRSQSKVSSSACKPPTKEAPSHEDPVASLEPSPTPTPTVSQAPPIVVAPDIKRSLRSFNIKTASTVRKKGCKSLKPGWFTSGSNPKDYQVMIQHEQEDASSFISEVAHLMNRVPTPKGNIQLSHCVPLEEEARTLTLTAETMAEDLEWAALQIYARDRKNRHLQRKTLALKGTYDWRNSRMSMILPKDTHHVEVGLKLGTPGQVWIRNLRVSAP